MHFREHFSRIRLITVAHSTQFFHIEHEHHKQICTTKFNDSNQIKPFKQTEITTEFLENQHEQRWINQ